MIMKSTKECIYVRCSLSDKRIYSCIISAAVSLSKYDEKINKIFIFF